MVLDYLSLFKTVPFHGANQIKFDRKTCRYAFGAKVIVVISSFVVIIVVIVVIFVIVVIVVVVVVIVVDWTF